MVPCREGLEFAKKHFDELLFPLGLTEQQIQSQNLNELKESLDSVNDAISHPESFSTIKLKLTASGIWVITSINQDAHFELGILPLLLERKRLIIERIGLLEGDQKVSNIQDLINHISDANIKSKLQNELKDLSSGSIQLQKELKELEKRQFQEKIDAQERFSKLQLELFERKAKTWQALWKSISERNSIATIVGAILLIAIVSTLIIGMFWKISSTDILNNVLLIILGYFFGQAGKAPSSQGDEK